MLIRGSEAAFIVIVRLSQSITGLFCVEQGFRRVGECLHIQRRRAWLSPGSGQHRQALNAHVMIGQDYQPMIFRGMKSDSDLKLVPRTAR
jgi:hypothetical protein